jgi:deoxyribonuclease-4
MDLLKLVKVIHLNDSKNDLSSHKDRHENIGKGFIGEKALKEFLKSPKFEGIITILETP